MSKAVCPEKIEVNGLGSKAIAVAAAITRDRQVTARRRDAHVAEGAFNRGTRDVPTLLVKLLARDACTPMFELPCVRPATPMAINIIMLSLFMAPAGEKAMSMALHAEGRGCIRARKLGVLQR